MKLFHNDMAFAILFVVGFGIGVAVMIDFIWRLITLPFRLLRRQSTEHQFDYTPGLLIGPDAFKALPPPRIDLNDTFDQLDAIVSELQARLT
jgi:hypothetical protein